MGTPGNETAEELVTYLKDLSGDLHHLLREDNAGPSRSRVPLPGIL